jgi:hypothetical protein
MRTGICYWRFKGEKAYRFGFCSHVQGRLYRMGYYNGDYNNGPIIDPSDVEIG